MNWFTRAFVKTTTTDAKKADLVAEHGGCEHVIENPSLLYVIQYENDSFGREGYCCCKVCYDAGEQARQEEPTTCHECKQTFPRSETTTWRWYDFYAPQGDTPMVICNTCYAAPKHQARMARDREEAQAESDYYRNLKR